MGWTVSDASDDVVLHTYGDGATLRADGRIVPPDLSRLVEALDAIDSDEVTVEYGVFNDEAAWEPLFASGEVHESLREVLLDRPLYATEILREAAQHARLTNEERGSRAETDKFGFVVVKTRTVTRSPWANVPLDEIARELGEY